MKPAMTFEPYCKNLVYIIVVHYRMFSTLLIRVPIVLMLPVFIFNKKKNVILNIRADMNFHLVNIVLDFLVRLAILKSNWDVMK